MKLLHTIVLSSLLALGCGAEAPAQSPEASTESPAAPAASHGKLAACTTDQSCNADPAISALWGTCEAETGKCSCREGAKLDPISERCSPVTP